MRIGQAIDNVYQNNNLEYESESLRVRYNIITCVVEVINKEKGYICNNLLMSFINENFKLIQKPVSFMEAVESGKAFRPERWREDTEMELDELLSEISHLYDTEDIRETLIGKFYIEEDN